MSLYFFISNKDAYDQEELWAEKVPTMFVTNIITGADPVIHLITLHTLQRAFGNSIHNAPHKVK